MFYWFPALKVKRLKLSLSFSPVESLPSLPILSLRRRKLSIGSEGSDSTGEKLNESFNRLTLSAGNQ